MKRKDADALVEAGAPIVLFYWAGGQLDWLDDEDSTAEWQAIRSTVTSQEPRPRGDLEWTAGRWEDDGGDAILFLTGHC